MDVSELGEFALIDRLTAILGAPASGEVVLGAGDDAAAWRSGGTVCLATTDTMVAGVHFQPEWDAWRDLGWKALASNVSDIAAMGGVPETALVTLAVPSRQPVEALDQLYEGLRDCAAAYGVTVLGGDVVAAAQLTITIALLGRAQLDGRGEPLLLRRDAARPGQSIAVTGTMGDSAAGLRILCGARPPESPLVRAHLRPQPPLAAGQAAVHLGVRCGMDISDGLVQDLGHICERSGVGAVLQADAIPISEPLRQAFPEEALALAASGGEDYQLLLVADEGLLYRLRDAIDVPLTVIGRTVAGPPQVRLLNAEGAEVSLATAGWEHLQ